MRGCSAARLASAVLGVALAANGGAVLAQEVSQATSGEAANSAPAGIDDIVVTASRREERLQTVPIAVTALTGATLASAGVATTNQLTNVVPNFAAFRNLGQTQLSIRGIGSRASQSGDESSVAVYIDGVYQPATYTGTLDLVEVERVEVLRGPQGTLFGRNATGGLLNIVTRDPSFDLKGNFTARYGSFDDRSVRAYVTGPLSNNVAIDIAGYYHGGGGYVRDLVRGGRTGDRTVYTGRGKLLAELSDRYRVTFSASYLDSDDRSAVQAQPINRNTAARNVPGVIIPPRPNEAALTFDPYLKIQQVSLTLKNQLEFGSFNVEAVTSYQHNRLHSVTDADATTLATSAIDSVQVDEPISQELRAISTGSGPFQWTVGAFGYWSTSRYDPFKIVSSTTSVLTTRNRTKSQAVFLEANYALTDQIKLLAGGRYTWEQRRFQGRNIAGNGAITSADVSASFEKFTPRVSLQYRPSNEAMIYATYSKGFKSGLFTTTSVNNPIAVNPESLEAYEVGFKADPTRWLRANFAAFYYDYSDIQVSARDPVNPILARLQNAASAHLKGAELELTVAATDDLQLRLAGAVLDTKFTRFPNAVVLVPNPNGGNTTTIADVSGNDLYRSPHYTLSAAADYSHDFAFGRAGFSANVFRSGHYWWDFSERLQQNGYFMISAQAWVEPVERLRIGIWGENLANATVKQNAVSSATVDYATYQSPRTFGVMVSYHL